MKPLIHEQIKQCIFFPQFFESMVIMSWSVKAEAILSSLWNPPPPPEITQFLCWREGKVTVGYMMIWRVCETLCPHLFWWVSSQNIQRGCEIGPWISVPAVLPVSWKNHWASLSASQTQSRDLSTLQASLGMQSKELYWETRLGR